MGAMIPYHQALENKQDSAYFAVEFDHFEHKVLIKDWYCDNPECDCMSVALYFLALHEDTKQSSELFFLMLDMNSWEIREQVIADKENADEMIAEFMDGLDEFHFKDLFKEHCRTVKEHGKKHYRPEDEMALYPGPDNIADDPLAFLYDGSRFLVTDQYCTNAKCHCNAVVLSFFRLSDRETQTPEFIFRLHLDSLDYKMEQINCDPDKIAGIVKRFLDKQGVLETLRHRYREMKKDGGKSHMKRITETEGKDHNPEPRRVAEPKAGRNDPCPCGSGKKYKKCCGLL
jgi:hypothetical protein